MSDKPRAPAPARRGIGPRRRERDPIRRDGCGVLLATRNAILREGLRSMIAQCGFRVFECPVTERGLTLDEASVRRCRIFVIDGSEDSDFGRTRAFVAQIRERNPRGHIVILIPPHPAHAPDPALVAEASAIVTTDVTGLVLGNLLQLVSENYVIRSAAIAVAPDPGQMPINQTPINQAPVMQAPIIQAALPPVLPPVEGRAVAGLSSRESEILLHVIRGSSNKVIARALGIAEATVKIHVKGIFRKIGVANRTQAAFHVFNQSRPGGEAAGRPDAVNHGAPPTNCFPTGLDIIVPRSVMR
ncbi:response regulator transcription factor [Methylorubrum sp. SB2]|uniref:helix-turn-helix transcriptional regulator n=1 Tax=Methylorubrum subtropicum TaxID=3138812 RepID=UPI00313E5747